MDKILDGYLDTDSLAAELGIHPVTLRKWRLRKEGPPVTYLGNGRKPLYRRTSVATWLASRETKPRS